QFAHTWMGSNMAAAAKVIPMASYTPAEENKGLPDPFSPLQRKCMAADLEATLKACTSAEEAQAAALDVVSIWTCRAARRYASDMVSHAVAHAQQQYDE